MSDSSTGNFLNPTYYIIEILWSFLLYLGKTSNSCKGERPNKTIVPAYRQTSSSESEEESDPPVRIKSFDMKSEDKAMEKYAAFVSVLSLLNAFIYFKMVFCTL